MGNSLKNIIAISGVTGFVGKNLTKYFDKNKISYLSVTRKLFEKNQVPSLQQCSYFIHLVGTGTETTENSFNQANFQTTKKAIEICKRSKIKKIIYFSGLGVSKDSTSNYFISKFNAEQIIINSGIDYTIFRPSYIIGKDDYLTKNIKKQIKKKKILIPGSGKYIIQPISINDVSRIVHVALSSKKFSNKIIDLVGPKKIYFKQFVKNSITKPSIKLVRVPLKDAFLNVGSNDFPYGIEELNILLGNFEGNHQKLENLCGIKFSETISV